MTAIPLSTVPGAPTSGVSDIAGVAGAAPLDLRCLSTASCLRWVARSDGWAAYHSLLGNLTLIDSAGKLFLDAFSESSTLNEVAKVFSEYALPVLRSYAARLIARGLLVPTGFDEYSMLRHDALNREQRLGTGYLVRALQLVLINSCNYKCKYCFMNLQSSERSDSRKLGSALAMSSEVAEAAMRSTLTLLRANGNKHLNVEFFGGEPLLNWPTIQHVLTTFGNQPTDGGEVTYSITTNGKLLSREIAEVFHTYGVTVTVSVDIPAKVKGLPLIMAKNGDSVRKSLEVLRSCRNTVTFNSVISKETIDYFDGRKLIQFAKEFGVETVGLILDLDLQFYREVGNRERALDLLLDTYRYSQVMGVRVGGYWHQIFDQITGHQPTVLRSGYKNCPATGVKVSVEPDGSLFTCKCTSGELGDVNHLRQALSSQAYADYAMSAYRHAPECGGCEIEGFCSGVCMGSFENEFERRDMIEAGACDMFRRLTRELIGIASGEEIYPLFLNDYALS